MRRAAVAALGFMLCCIGASAPAQTPEGPRTPGQEPVLPAPKLSLTLEQRHVIRELIKDAKPQSSSDLHPAIGDTVPENVNLNPMPGEVAQKVPQVKAHRFFIADDEIVIVDPKDRRVAELIKLREE